MSKSSVSGTTSWGLWMCAIPLVALIVLTGGCRRGTSPQPSSLAPLQVFEDRFDSSNTYGTYTGLGGATVVMESGRLNVRMPDSVPSGGAGFKLELPSPKDGVGVRCLRFADFIIPEAPVGTFMNWRWYGFDNVTGGRILVLATDIEKSGSFTIRHRKPNGTLVEESFPGRSWSEVKTKRWDTRRDGTQVMLEIEFKDGTRYNSNWLDPSASLIAGFELLATVPSFSIGLVEGNQYHWEAPKSGQLALFDDPALNTLSPYFVGQGADADLVAVATITEVGAVEDPIGDDPRRRLRVVYQLNSILKGTMPMDKLIVFHAIGKEGAEKFRRDNQLILYLKRGTGVRNGDGESWFWDYGDPTGVIRFSAQNLEAAFVRL